MMARAQMSPLTSLICMCKLTQLAMARKTPLNHSLPSSEPSCSDPVATLSTYNVKSKTLMTGYWLGRSPSSTSSMPKLQNSLCELKFCTKSSIPPMTPGPCPRSGSSSPEHLKRLLVSRTSRRRLSCHTPPSNARATVNEDVSSN
jgi:hypothetical protein